MYVRLTDVRARLLANRFCESLQRIASGRVHFEHAPRYSGSFGVNSMVRALRCFLVHPLVHFFLEIGHIVTCNDQMNVVHEHVA